MVTGDLSLRRLTLRMMTSPRDFMCRVDERIEFVDSSTLRRHITFLVDLDQSLIPHRDEKSAGASTPVGETASASAASAVVLPILTFAKDRLLNDFPVVDRHGQTLEVLNRRMAFRAQSEAVMAFVEEALSDWSPVPPLERAPAVNWLVRKLANMPYQQPERANQTYEAVFGAKVDRLNAVNVPLGVGDAAAHLRTDDQVRRVCRTMIAYEYMFVSLPASSLVDGKVEVHMSYDSLNVHREPVRSRRAFFRRWLGGLPHTVRIHTPMAFLAQSYHVRMNGPDHHYVWEQSFKRLAHLATEVDAPREHASLVPIPKPQHGVVLGAPTRPSSQAHLYAGELRSEEHGRVYAMFTFLEKPPGFTGLALMTASLMSALLLAFLIEWRDLDDAGRHNIDLAAVLVALPGVISVLVIPMLTSVPVTLGPLAARITFVYTAFASVIGAGVFALSLQGTAVGLATWAILLLGQLWLCAWLLKNHRGNMRDYRDVLAFYSARAERYSKGDFKRGVDTYGRSEHKWLVENRGRSAAGRE